MIRCIFVAICAISWNQIQKTVEEVERTVVEYSLQWEQLKCVTTCGGRKMWQD
jgi:hypothetical protein